MAIETTTNRVAFAGNGVTTAFSFPYYFLLEADLVVLLKVNATNVVTTKTLTTHYTITGEGDEAGGTVTMLTAPATGETLIIYRDPGVIQDTDWEDNDSNPASVKEQAFDKLTMIGQRIKEIATRSVRLKEGFTASFDLTLPIDLETALDKVPTINAAGTGWAAVSAWPTVGDIEDAEENAAAAAASAAAAAASAAAALVAENNAETAETNAETAETNAELAETNAEAAQAAALASQIAAAASAAAALVSENNAETAETNAELAETNAETAETNAEAAATAAAASAAAALVSENNAETAETNAETAETNAEAAAAAAAASAASFLPQSSGIYNLGLSASVAANALTIAMKDMAGSDPTAGSAVKISFRSATAGSGVFNERSVSAALSLVISSGSTLGHINALTHYIYVYGIDNAGTVELAASTTFFDDGTLVTTTAEGGAGAADNARTIYSTTARTTVPVRLIGRIKISEATAGTWATAPTEVSVMPFHVPKISAKVYVSGSSTISTTASKITFGGNVHNDHGAYLTATGTFYAARPGVLRFSNQYGFNAPYTGTVRSFVYKNGAQDCVLGAVYMGGSDTTFIGSTTVKVAAGDYCEIYSDVSTGTAGIFLNASYSWLCIEEI